jgi:hypothetical protein
MSTGTRADSAEKLADRLAMIEAEREINQLVHDYAVLCDRAYEPDGLTALFTEDATWSSRSKDGSIDFGLHRGKREIHDFFAAISGNLGPMTLHYLLTPRIDVAPDGLSASGHWYLLAILDQRPAGADADSNERERIVLGGTYSHEYRKVGDRWLFSRLDCDLTLQAPFPS